MTDDANNITGMGFYLNRAFSKLVNTLNDMLSASCIPINHSQFEVLQLLWNSGKGNVSQQEIANIIGRDKAAVSRALSHLETQGYIERKPISGSKNGVSLTPKGVGIQPQLANILSEAIQDFCKTLTTGESLQLTSLLKKTIDNSMACQAKD